MRISFDHSFPFVLTHGGFQTQIEQTALGLRACGVEVEFLRWWDDGPLPELIHYFGVAHLPYLQQARDKGIPVVMSTLFTETCNRSAAQLRRQGWMIQSILKIPFGRGIKQQLSWLSFHHCSCMMVGLEAERKVLETVYGVPPDKIAVIPLGLSETFLAAGPGTRPQKHLVYTGTITERKRCVDLARLALRAQVPVRFIGKPYAVADPYWKEFSALIDNTLVQYEPHVKDERSMVAHLHEARGFVILSRNENWCLSAHEAAACGLPLLLPDLNWSRERFGDQASYVSGDFETQAQQLRQFYERCSHAPIPKVRLFSWREVAEQIRVVYQRVLSSSR
jgi:glycosyltransferase involved in cell wall biosynthesis